MRPRIFYKIPNSLDTPKNIWALTENQDTKKELARLKWELDQEKNEAKKKDLMRKITRLERFDTLRELSGTDEKINNVKKILAWKTTEDYLWSDLLSLKKQGIDIAALVLVSDKKIDLDITSAGIKEGDAFTVNFGDNKHLGANIGAGDILPAEIGTVRINGKEWTRKNTPRPGYYDEKGKYLPIFDGYKIEIVAFWKLDENTMEQASEATERRWRKLRASDMFDHNDKNPLTDLSEDKSLFSDVTEVAKERSVKKLDTLFSSWEKSKFAVESLVRLGWTKEQSVGIVANLIGESNLNHTVDTGDGWKAYGIAQWHPNRQRDFIKVFWKPIQSSSFEEQLSFVDWELRNTEQSAWNMLRYASNSSEATDIITRYYERPADKEGDVRKRTQIALQLEKKIT